MNYTSSCGDGGVCMRLVRLSFNVIGSILLHLVNSSLSLSEVPPSWKHSLVFPIFKSGDHSNPSNFRPISIVPTVAKIVERAVQQQQLYGYLSRNHLLSSSLHGFRPGHSTETALTSISDLILSANDRGEVSLLCLLDFSKCFDEIDQTTQNHWPSSVHTASTRPGSRLTFKITPRVSASLTLVGPLNCLPSFPATSASFRDLRWAPCSSACPRMIFANLRRKQRRSNTQMTLNFWLEAQNITFKIRLLVRGVFSPLSIYGFLSTVWNPTLTKPSWCREAGRTCAASPLSLWNSAITIFVPCSEANNLGLVFDRTLSWDSHITSQNAASVCYRVCHIWGTACHIMCSLRWSTP